MTYLLPADPENPPVTVDAAPWGVAPGRTYITPDDWYANHGLAPGDARWPQKSIEGSQRAAAAWGDATSGKLVPTPPMRGYYGKPPFKLPLPLARSAVTGRRLVTRSPFAVSDVMWGVHGLGDVSTQSIDAVLARMNKDMKKLLMEQAATAAAIGLALSVTPIIGQVAGLVYAVVQGIVGAQNQRQAQAVMADTEHQAKAIAASYQTKLSAQQDAVWAAEAPAGIQLATTCTNLDGLHGLGRLGSPFGIKNIVKQTALFAVNPLAPLVKPIQKVIKKVAPKSVSHVTDVVIAKPTAQLEKNIVKGIDVMSGEAAVQKAKAARAKILAKVEADMKAQYDQVVANMNTTAYRTNLRKQIAIKLRSDPSVQTALSQQCLIMPSTGTYVDPNTGIPDAAVNEAMPAGSKAAPWAGLAAAAVTFLAFGLGHK